MKTRAIQAKRFESVKGVYSNAQMSSSMQRKYCQLDESGGRLLKTAMDVRIGLPNEHLAGTAKNEINQPMYATSVGLIMRGFEYLETYKMTFNAGSSEEYIKPKSVVVENHETEGQEEETFVSPVQEEEKISLTDKIKTMLSRMFEVEDQPITNNK